jgi:hypothetical protein
MGRERKRGKLADFNRFLRGGSPSGFSEIVGETTVLPPIRYVITLDTDTQLPREAARRHGAAMLVGLSAHVDHANPPLRVHVAESPISRHFRQGV